MRIAMLGLRGVPATWGGPERSVEELGALLAARGHDVTVYCRRNYQPQQITEHRGMRLITLPTVNSKHLDAIAHSALSAINAVPKRYDIVNFHTIGPGLVAPIPRLLTRSKVVLTVRGLDNKRSKWNSGAKRVLDLAEWMSGRVPHHVIAVSQDLERHYRENHPAAVSYIPNGIAKPPQGLSADLLTRFGVEPQSYVLSVGRLVPEKVPDLLLRAFHEVPGNTRLVVAGGTSFTDDYVRELETLAAKDDRIVMPGYVYGDELAALYEHAKAFVTPSLLEGLPRTLLEATSHGVPVIASDIPPHREILGDNAPGHRLVKPDDLSALRDALSGDWCDSENERAGAVATQERVLRDYSWDGVVDETERLFRSLLNARR